MTTNLATSLITKLTVANRLEGDDIRAIQRLPIRARSMKTREVIVRDGERPQECCLLAEGFAYRSKITEDGGRQVLSLHIPGEIPDLQSLHLKVMDHDLMTLTPCVLGFIAHEDLRELNRARPTLAEALWRETLIDASIFREWIVNVGRRSATARLAHLLVELHRRLEAIGHTRDGKFDLPITQADLADCLGLSTVHINRVLQFLRKEGLLTADRSDFRLVDTKKMEDLAGFDAAYLHQQPDA